MQVAVTNRRVEVATMPSCLKRSVVVGVIGLNRRLLGVAPTAAQTL